MSKVHYKGLTDAQVLESRAKYGANVLTPPEEDSIWDQIKEVCIHPIAITMFILIAATAVLAGVLVGSMGTTIFVMPAIVAIVSVVMIAIYTIPQLRGFFHIAPISWLEASSALVLSAGIVWLVAPLRKLVAYAHSKNQKAG